MNDPGQLLTAKVENAAGDKIAEADARITDERHGTFTTDHASEPEQIVKNAAFIYFTSGAERYKLLDLKYDESAAAFDFNCEKM